MTTAATGGRTITLTPASKRDEPVLAAARKRRIGRFLSLLAPILLLVLWQLSSSRGWIDYRVFSSPREVGQTAWDLVQTNVFWNNLFPTIRRILIGYTAGSIAGILLGTLLGVSTLARSAIRPLVAGAQTVPTLALLPLFVLIFGLTETPKYLVTFWGMTVLVTLGTTDAVANVPTSYLEAARSLGTSRLQTFVQVIAPASLGRIFTSLRIGIGLGVLSVIGVEFVFGNEGVGRQIWTASNLFLPADMFVYIIVAALLGVTLNGIIGLLQKLAMPWQREGERIVA